MHSTCNCLSLVPSFQSLHIPYSKWRTAGQGLGARLCDGQLGKAWEQDYVTDSWARPGSKTMWRTAGQGLGARLRDGQLGKAWEQDYVTDSWARPGSKTTWRTAGQGLGARLRDGQLGKAWEQDYVTDSLARPKEQDYVTDSWARPGSKTTWRTAWQGPRSKTTVIYLKLEHRTWEHWKSFRVHLWCVTNGSMKGSQLHHQLKGRSKKLIF